MLDQREVPKKLRCSNSGFGSRGGDKRKEAERSQIWALGADYLITLFSGSSCFLPKVLAGPDFMVLLVLLVLLYRNQPLPPSSPQ